MKKIHWFTLSLVLLLCLSGCGQAALPKTADGQEWSDDWVTVGNVIGVDTLDGLTAQENSDALTANGMYYATWSIGEAESYVNEDGDDAQIYDAQIYFLLAGYNSTNKAEENMDKWLSMASDQYEVTETVTEIYNGQEFTVISYTYKSEDNPYDHGVSAFGTYGNYAISVELSCQESFDGNALDVLENFLENCHYAA